MEPPGRREIDAAATALVARHGAQILATARRYAATPEDAEDAYQRGLEILLRKAPTTRECELVPCGQVGHHRPEHTSLTLRKEHFQLVAWAPRAGRSLSRIAIVK